jgi:hypothetical protein
VLAAPRGSWAVAIGTTVFALAGVVLGLSIILSGSVSRPADVTYHSIILVALIVTVVLQLSRQGRAALRR